MSILNNNLVIRLRETEQKFNWEILSAEVHMIHKFNVTSRKRRRKMSSTP